MQLKKELTIWHTIVEQAKSKFDYAYFKDLFNQINEEMMDKLLFHILAAFASGEEHNTISTNLLNELHHLGYEIKEEEIDRFLSDKHVVFSTEIYATYLAFHMLEEEADIEEIISSVNEVLDLPHS